MKFLVVGLGNPGAEYSETRHNIGFKALDALSAASNAIFIPGRLAEICTVQHKGKTLMLCKPNTFMNLSGKAVNYWMQSEKITVDRLIVVTDDIALPFGKIRIRPRGSAGGHNGLRSIEETLGTQEYCRLRFGVGSDFPVGRQSEYVLSSWNSEEEHALPTRLSLVKEAVLSIALAGVQRAMSEFNNR
jgi:PTH1 family peptidyl-tRNA hydrolase